MNYIRDINGFVAQGPSNGGMSEIRSLLSKKDLVNPGKTPMTLMLLEEGYATSPLRLRLELSAIANKIKDNNIRQSLVELANTAGKCKDIVMLTHNL